MIPLGPGFLLNAPTPAFPLAQGPPSTPPLSPEAQKPMLISLLGPLSNSMEQPASPGVLVPQGTPLQRLHSWSASLNWRGLTRFYFSPPLLGSFPNTHAQQTGIAVLNPSFTFKKTMRLGSHPRNWPVWGPGIRNLERPPGSASFYQC